MWQAVRAREVGIATPQAVAARLRASRIRGLALAQQKEVVSAHRTAINSLQVDLVEARYLLAGASDGSLSIYDIQQPTSYDATNGAALHTALCTVEKGAAQAHRFSVASVQWYPIDTGLFVSGAFDTNVNVWDTNSLRVEVQFSMPGKVYGIAMSPIASTHTLIAVGSQDHRVRLCDIASGGFTHTLTGHKDAVWAVQWSTSSEWVLATGGCDGAVRLWDIRRAGCFAVFDQHHALRGQRSYSTASAAGEAVPHNRSRSANARSPAGRLLPSRRGKASSVGAEERRRHPGTASEKDRATAHDGAVTALQYTPDGLHLLSAGTDSRMRLWETASGCNTLVNYEKTRNRAAKGTQIALSPDGRRVYHPSGSTIQVYDTWSGALVTTMRGHYDSINCCSFHAQDQELYSGSNDRQILVWSPPPPPGLLEDRIQKAAAGLPPGTLPDVDAWSEDEDDRSYLRRRF